jgi:hypothetical protein
MRRQRRPALDGGQAFDAESSAKGTGRTIPNPLIKAAGSTSVLPLN